MKYKNSTITHLDSLGRPFYVITNDGNGNKPVTRTVLDIEGNEKRIVDALGRDVMEYKYGIHGEKAYTKSMDAGERWMLLAADEQPIYTWDSREYIMHMEFDALRRPVRQKLKKGNNAEITVGKTVYGEEAGNPNSKQNNLRGQIWKVYDQSGEVVNVKYDFKGNLLESKRQLTQEYKQTINWDANPTLETETFATITAYDALNRATEIQTPHNSNIPASKIIPEYDDGGLLKGVKAKLRGATEATSFVEAINYNSKAQRTRIKYGNGATTKYTYDDKTFRLTRLWTFRNGGTENLQDLNYTYDPVGNITEITDNAQKVVFFDNQLVNPSQTFEYDALYRLTKTTGREHAENVADMETLFEGYPHAHTSIPNDVVALRNYTRKWKYDEIGNILKLIHSVNNGSGNWNRSYEYEQNNNQLMSTKVGNGASVNYKYNEHGSMKKIPHLEEMTWDFAERLCYVERGTTKAYYNYDGSGERVRKVVEKGSIVETKLYLGGVEIYRKKDGNTLELERETLHVMDDTKRIAIVETLTAGSGAPASVQRYQLSNNIESATLELDDEANIISYEEYYPYGDTSYQAGRSASEVSQKRYRYTGKEKDEESGFYYHGARYYACWLGRWTAVDPAGLVDGLNLYMYCRGNPVIFLDSDGNQTSDGTGYDERSENSTQYHGGRGFNFPTYPEWFHSTGLDIIINDLENEIASGFFSEEVTKNKSEGLSHYKSYKENHGYSYMNAHKKISMHSYESMDEAAKAGLEILVDISKETNLEHSATITEIEGRFYLSNLAPGIGHDAPIMGTTGENLGFIHTHISGGMKTFSPADFEQSYKLEKTLYLRHTEDKKGHVFKLVPPEKSNTRISTELLRIGDNKGKRSNFLKKASQVTKLK